MIIDNPSPKLVGGLGEINFGKQYRQGNRVYDSESVAMCLTAQPLGNAGGNSYLYLTDESTEIQNPSLRIRKLTPKECYRLMGFDDEAFERAEQVNSNTQLYKQAGNSIVVDVLVAIFDSLLIHGCSAWLDELLEDKEIDDD
jgi:DNA (cytosine-5)-methyltransferase 1